LQDDLFKANFYLSLMEFRDLTLRRLQAFSARGFFSVADYIRDPLRFQAALEVMFCPPGVLFKRALPYARRFM
jgi:acyl-CoA oxidase